MFVSTNGFRIKKGHGRDLEERFKERGGVEKQPGFLGFQLWRKDGAAGDEEYVVVTHWESKEAHHQWTRSEEFKAAHSGPRAGFILGHPEFSGYDVRLLSDPSEAKAPPGSSTPS